MTEANVCDSLKTFAASEKIDIFRGHKQLCDFRDNMFKATLENNFCDNEISDKFRKMVTNFVSNLHKRKQKTMPNVNKKSSADQNAVQNLRSSEATTVKACKILLAITDGKSDFC